MIRKFDQRVATTANVKVTNVVVRVPFRSDLPRYRWNVALRKIYSIRLNEPRSDSADSVLESRRSQPDRRVYLEETADRLS